LQASNRSREFLTVLLKHKNRSKNYQKGQGPKCKLVWVSSSFSRRLTGRPPAGGVGVLRRPGDRVAGAGVGRDRGRLGDVLTSGGKRQQGCRRRTISDDRRPWWPAARALRGCGAAGRARACAGACGSPFIGARTRGALGTHAQVAAAIALARLG
jgi:hypothetical protein